MKKLAVFLMIPALVLLTTAMVSADGDHHWWGIHGTYAMTATGNCVHTWNSPAPQFYTGPYGASNMVQGFFDFNKDGTGTAWGENWPIIPPPTPPAPASLVGPSDGKFYFEFTYDVTREGEITVRIKTDTFLGTNNVNGFTFGSNDCADAVNGSCTMSGMVSRDHKTMTLATKAMMPVVAGGVVTGYASYIQEYTFLTGPLTGKTMTANCSIARTLFRVDE